MNQTSAPSWSQIAHHDPMVSAPEDDFASFLEFGDVHLNYGDYELSHADGQDNPQDAVNTVDTGMEISGGLNELREEHLLHQQDGAGSGHNEMRLPLEMTSMEDMTESEEPLMDFNLQAEIFHQQQEHMQTQNFHPHAIIPPTPNSMKMHGGTEHYYPQLDLQAQAIYERYSRMKEDQMVFTPLVSPAVTPLDTRFRIPEYTLPGEYFSPLTSPALEAQNAAARRSVYGNARYSDTSVGNSPIDMNLDLAASASLPSMTPIRKSRRKASANTFRNPTRTVRQSPAMKPQSRRRSTVIPPKEVADVIQDAQNSRTAGTRTPHASGLPAPSNQDSSEAESISPEPLSEALMPPPATPKSVTTGRSPYLTAQHVGSRSAPLLPMSNEPATPASLMKLRKPTGRPPRQGNMNSGGSEVQVELIRPEAAKSTKPSLPPIDTAQANDDQTTPTLSAKNTPRLGPPSASLTSASSSVMPSPQLSAVASPTGSVVGRRLDSKPAGRPSKKRNSASSVHVSPALRPKISPSIKPLLPEGGTVNLETSTLLLASKSNYQNILEGTHLPGVSYPEALSTNLTSKRTSHKIAEQGRRNRINNALQEIASLLPPSASGTSGRMNNGREESGSGSGGDGGGGGGGGITTGTAAQQSNSKASTVEMAIDYIKALKKELADTKGRLDAVERKLEGGGG